MIQKIACIGAGFVGGPFGAVIAYKCPDVQVTIVDKDKERIEAWNTGSLPMYEPGLDEIVSLARQRPTLFDTDGDLPDNLIHDHQGKPGGLRFSTDVEAAIDEAEMIILCVNTPTKRFGAGKGMAADLSHLQAAVKTIARVSASDKIVVEKSTVPCGTADMIRDLLESSSCNGVRFEVLSNPEFLSEGTAIQDLLQPSRVLIGSKPDDAGRDAASKLADIYRAWTPPEKIIMMDLWSSELSKLAANAMLAQRLSSINSLSAICEAVGANIDSVSSACGLDHRIGTAMLKRSLGWGGGCFQKDVLNLVYIARSLHLDTVADYWAAVVAMNEDQKGRFLRRIISCMHGGVTGKNIAVLGFAYKKDTSDAKDSAAIRLVVDLLAEGANVAVYDPMVTEDRIVAELRGAGVDAEHLETLVRVSPSAYQACDAADALVLATEWDEFRTPACNSKSNSRSRHQSTTSTSSLDSAYASASPDRAHEGTVLSIDGCLTPDSDEGAFMPNTRGQDLPDWERIVGSMQKPPFIFDGRGLLDGSFLSKLGCRYVGVGQASRWDVTHSTQTRRTFQMYSDVSF